MAHDISNMDDVIDSRDVIARIDELETLRDDAQNGKATNGADEPCADCGVGPDAEHTDECNGGLHDLPAKETMEDGTKIYTSDNFTEDEYRELKALLALAEEASGYAADWHHGEILIRDSYFETYAQELAEDCGMVKEGAQWPNNCIDWEQVARELQQDYTAVSFDGIDYWIR